MPDFATQTSGADTLPLDQLQETIRKAIRNEYDVIDYPRPPEITEMYINGSYGGKAAGPQSDIDVCVSILPTDEVEQVHWVLWAEFSQHLCEVLTPFDGWWEIDIMVLPEGEEFVEHVVDRCRHGDYETVFDVGGREYIPVERLISSRN